MKAEMRIAQIRMAHAKAKSTNDIPAWRGIHADVGFLLDYIDVITRRVLASHSQTSATEKTLVPADALPSNEVIRATDTGGGK